MSVLSIIIATFAVLNFLCLIAVLFFERKNPSSSLLWVLILAFLPIIGFIAYIFLGAGFRVNKRKRYELKAISDDIYNNYITKQLSLKASTPSIPKSAERLATYLARQPDGIYTQNNTAELFVDGTPTFERMMEDMKKATHHIHLLFFIFRNDDVGGRILSILEEKARAGVEVRLLYDSVGTFMATDAPFRKLKEAGGEVHAFAPVLSSFNSSLRVNYRNHRKITVIDGCVGYVGGMNVGDEYCGHHKRLTPWRDTHMRITGSAVWLLQERFIVDWAYSSEIDPQGIDGAAYFPDPVEVGGIGMQIISSGPDTFEKPIKSGMLEMLYSARERISIQTPYFAPDESLSDALRIAVRSGVDVRLMIPKLPDHRFVYKITLGYVREMLGMGVKVYLFNGFIHSKTITIDGLFATVGTTNLTNRSFSLDFEINAFVYDAVFARKCEAAFEKDMREGELLPGDYFDNQSVVTRAAYNVTRLLAPMV